MCVLISHSSILYLKCFILSRTQGCNHGTCLVTDLSYAIMLLTCMVDERFQVGSTSFKWTSCARLIALICGELRCWDHIRDFCEISTPASSAVLQTRPVIALQRQHISCQQGVVTCQILSETSHVTKLPSIHITIFTILHLKTSSEYTTFADTYSIEQTKTLWK